MLRRNDPCWCGSGQKWKKCCYPATPPQRFTDELRREYQQHYDILLKDERQIEGIRTAGKLAAHILEELCRHAKAGVTTAELDALSRQMHKDAGARPAPLGYGTPPFPQSICTSLNNVICHGIPDDRPLEDGDIVNIDVTAQLNGYFGDCSQMVIIGKTTKERAHVTEVAYECLQRGIQAAKPGNRVCDIGEAITQYAESQNCSVVHQFVAHGVGMQFHENPQILHCRNNDRTPLVPGMTFTIEPMINIGSPDAVIDPDDGWTARTVDGKDSAQWEYTVVVTEDGCEILTPWTRVSKP